jgi:hypothetical protein
MRSSSLVTAIGVASTLGLTTLPGIYWTPPVSPGHRISEDQVGLGTAAEQRLSERSAYDDYFPTWVEERATQIPQPPSRGSVDAYRHASGGPPPSVRVLERGYIHTRLETGSQIATMLVLHAFYFPGWQARVDGEPHRVEPTGPLGLAAVRLPPGFHRIDLSFGETPIRLVANLISAVAALFLVAVFARAVGRGRTLACLAIVALAVGGPWTLHLATAPERATLRPLDQPVTAAARLVGVELVERSYSPGETMGATLLWLATAYADADFQSGLHLEPLDGGPVTAERWARPGRESTPTGKWIVGELVPDPLALRIPLDTPPGRYRLLAGLREAGRRERAVPALASIAEIDVR